MTTSLARWGWIVWGLGVALGCASSTSGDASERGAEPVADWFESCSSDADCEEGDCLCGVCTVACVNDAQCAELSPHAECVETSSLAECEAEMSGRVCGDEAGDLASLAETSSGADLADGDSNDSAASDDAPRDDAASSDDASDDSADSDDANSDDASSDDANSDDANSDDASSDDASTPDPAQAPTKLDLLFVIDNSRSMSDKHALFAAGLPELVEQFTSPPCVDELGNYVPAVPGAAECPAGTRRLFTPVTDLHLGVVTSSLGAYGSAVDCIPGAEEHTAQLADMARLLASLPRGAAAAPSAAGAGFLRWSPGADTTVLADELANLIVSAGEFGCGWEATLESWVRFLVDPYPYTRVVRQPCNAEDTTNLCNGPETDGQGAQLIDQVVLDQRRQFLRPDSLLAIVMLSDENDCSFRSTGQTWILAQTSGEDGTFSPAYRATAACDDPAYGSNHECCHSCGQAAAPDGCPVTVDAEGRSVGAGCEGGPTHAGPIEDAPALRCFQQKRRFGVDFLYPVERYSNALSLPRICPFADDLDPTSAACPGGVGVTDNPVFAPQRSASWIYLAGVLGVPWQDLAVSLEDAPLRLRSNQSDAEAATRIDWDLILGERHPPSGIPAPLDPLMQESIEPRTGVHPPTGVALAPPGSGFMTHPVNGHEWNIPEQDDLQYACIFPLATERECPSFDEYLERASAGEVLRPCECTDREDATYQSPLCQAPDGSFDLTQRFAKAYPGLRQLQVLHDFGENAIVGSICPKSMDPGDVDHGYRPLTRAIVSRVAEVLERPLAE